MQYRPDIDGLRAVAVLPVLFYHAGLAGFSGGFVGVDVFFVISGYLITRIIHDEMMQGRFSILHFYERRARRILPALFAVLAATFAMGWVWLSPGDYGAMAGAAASVLVFLSNLWFWQNSGGYFDGATDYLPLLHTWSLAVEEQFYILFPLVLLVLVRWGRGATLGVTLALVAGSLALAAWATPRMPSASFYLLPTRFWEMGLGSLLAPVLGAAALIWAGGAGGSLVGQMLSWRPVVFVGLLSYSLYLWHWPIMAFARNRLVSVELPPLWQVGTIALSLTLAWVSWRYVERPFRAGLGLTRGGVFATSGAGIAVLGTAGLAVVLSDGAERRYSQSELEILQGLGRDPQAEACGGARPLEQLCVFNDDTADPAGSWLFWGDSHAEAALPAIMDIAADRGQRLVYANQSACAPLPAIDRLDLSLSARNNCDAFRTRIERHALDSGLYDTVFLHARWPLYVEGEGYGNAPETSIGLAARNGTELADIIQSGANPEIVATALIALAERLVDAGKTVVLIGSVPEIPWDVADHMKAFALYGETVPSPPSLETVTARQGRSKAILEAVARETGALYIPVSDSVCSDSCPTHDGLTAFYRDTHHLTPEGARRLFAPLLRAALPFDTTAPAQTD